MVLKKAFLLFKTDTEIISLATQYDLPMSAINQVLTEIYSQIGSYYKVDDFIYNFTAKNIFKSLKEDGVTIYFITDKTEVENSIAEIIQSNFIEEIFSEMKEQQEFEKLFNPTSLVIGSHSKVYEDFTENMNKKIKAFTNKKMLSMSLKEKEKDFKREIKI